MKIDTLKDLQKLIQLCKKTGTDHIRVGDVEIWINFNEAPQTEAKFVNESLPLGEVGVDTKIQTDELTPEQLLMWSSAPSDQ